MTCYGTCFHLRHLGMSRVGPIRRGFTYRPAQASSGCSAPRCPGARCRPASASGTPPMRAIACGVSRACGSASLTHSAQLAPLPIKNERPQDPKCRCMASRRAYSVAETSAPHGHSRLGDARSAVPVAHDAVDRRSRRYPWDGSGWCMMNGPGPWRGRGNLACGRAEGAMDG